MNRFEGKIAIVTGASRGIGRAIALRLAREGADLGINYRDHSDAAMEVAEEIRGMGRRAEILQADVRHDQDVRRMVADAERLLGPISVWVNNAGVEFEEPLEDISEEHWDETFNVNVKGVFFCSRAVGEIMLGRSSRETLPGDAQVGSIVNVASRFGLLGDPTSLPYGASKAAVINITKALAKHYAPQIRVNAVAPAFTPTDMMAHVDDAYLARFHAATPLARITKPEDTAAAVAFLSSEDAAFTTGTVLSVDGGYTLK